MANEIFHQINPCQCQFALSAFNGALKCQLNLKMEFLYQMELGGDVLRKQESSTVNTANSISGMQMMIYFAFFKLHKKI